MELKPFDADIDADIGIDDTEDYTTSTTSFDNPAFDPY